jgi:hypothetical protein
VEADVLLRREVQVDRRVLEDDPDAAATAFASRSRSWPSIVTVPLVFARVVVRIEIVVVLPAPFGPRNAKSSPARRRS